MRGSVQIRAGSNVAVVGRNDPDNKLNVNDWNRDNGYDNVGAVPAVVSIIERYFAWRTLSTRQASCLFLGEYFEAPNSVYLLLTDCLWQALIEPLLGQVLCLFCLEQQLYFPNGKRKKEVQKYPKLSYLIFAQEYNALFLGKRLWWELNSCKNRRV